MHQYLRSIGFSELTREQDIDKFFKNCQKHCMPDARRYIDANEQMWLDIRVPCSEQMGICIVGYIGARGVFNRTAYYPYLISSDTTSTVKPSVFRRVDGTLFSAIIDDSRVGMTLIFQLDNFFDYLHKFGENNPVTGDAKSRLTGFCTKGYVLLPSFKKDISGKKVAAGGRKGQKEMPEISAEQGIDIGQLPFALNPSDIEAAFNNAADSKPNGQDQDERMSLMEAARNGQTEAIEQLAFEEMNTIASLSKRLQNEDIYSIVDSVFMPQGVECDIYLVVGDILWVETIINETSGEKIWDLTIMVNDMIIHVAVNEADLEGEPMIGRRFKGRIWLQGRIDF